MRIFALSGGYWSCGFGFWTIREGELESWCEICSLLMLVILMRMRDGILLCYPMSYKFCGGTILTHTLTFARILGILPIFSTLWLLAAADFSI